MTNANDPIVQTVYRQIGDNEYRIATPKDIKEGIYLHTTPGLTKREYFAAMALQGLLGDADRNGSYDEYADDAVIYADALIKALNESK